MANYIPRFSDNRNIQDYNGFGDWAQNRGGDVLSTLGDILQQGGGFARKVDEEKKAKLMQRAMANIAKKMGVAELIPPTIGKEKRTYTEQPYLDGRPQKQVTGNFETVTQTPEQNLDNMATGDIEKLMGALPQEGGGSGRSDEPTLNQLYSQYQTANQFAKELKSNNPSGYKALITSLESKLSQKDPTFQAQFGANTQEAQARQVIQTQLNSVISDKNKMKEFKKSGLSQDAFESWARGKGYIQ